MSKRIDQLPVASSVANTDIIVVGNPSTGAMKKALVSQVKAGNTAISLTDAATVTWDFATGNIAKVTIAGNRTLTLSNVPANSCGLLTVKQDATGGRTMSLPGNSATGFGYSIGPGEEDVLGFFYDGTTYYWSVSNYGNPATLPQLSAPASLTPTVASDTQIDLDWPNVTSATGYILQRSTSPTFSSGVSTIYTGATSAFSDTGLSASTTYYYRVQATAPGYSSSPYATGNATTSAAFVTWFSIGADQEQYNSNKGLRKKSSGASDWNSGAWSVDPLILGQAVVYKVDVTTGSYMVGINSTREAAAAPVLWDYQMQSSNGNLYYYPDTGGPVDTTHDLATGHLLRFKYTASNILFELSTNGGTSWTTLYTHPTAPSGGYYIGINVFNANNGCSEITR